MEYKEKLVDLRTRITERQAKFIKKQANKYKQPQAIIIRDIINKAISNPQDKN